MPGDLDLKTESQRTEGDALVRDIRLKGIDFFLVEPVDLQPRAAALFLHWVSSEGGDRTQFLQEAIELASFGVVSALPQGDFPWNGEPTSSADDTRRIEAEIGRYAIVAACLRAGDRIELPWSIVGHDFGAMYGTLLARMFKPDAMVVISATPRWADWFLAFWPIKEDRFDYLRELHYLDPIVQVAELKDVPSLFQYSDRDFFIAEMTAREFQEAAGPQAELLLYPGDHALDLPEVRDARRMFLLDRLHVPAPTP